MAVLCLPKVCFFMKKKWEGTKGKQHLKVNLKWFAKGRAKNADLLKKVLSEMWCELVGCFWNIDLHN